jgi:hypothetical protein
MEAILIIVIGSLIATGLVYLAILKDEQKRSETPSDETNDEDNEGL